MNDLAVPAVSRRAARALIAIGVAHGALAATHGGEFWPFSIYPMFSAAGRPWSRALVVDASSLPAGKQPAQQYTLEQLPGAAFGLESHGIPQNDLSSLVQRAQGWREPELEALRRLFGSLPCERALMVLVVRGNLAADALHYVATPLATLRCDGGRVDVELFVRPQLSSALGSAR